MRTINKINWLLIGAAALAAGLLTRKLIAGHSKRKSPQFREMIRRIKLIRSGQTMNQTLDTAKGSPY